MPTMLPGGYRSPYAQTIAELMMRQGDIAARSAERSGQIWGNAVGNLGQIGAQAYEQHQEEKKQKAQSAALDQFVQSGAWHDPDVALAGSVKILGPERGAKFAEGLVSAARLHQGPKPEEAMKALPGIIRGLEAAPDDLKPGLYSSARNLVVSSGIARPQDIPEQYDPRMMSTLSAWANDPKTNEAYTLSPGAQRRDAQNRIVAENPAAKTASGPSVGSFEDYLVRKFGPNPSPQQIESARRAYNQSDDRLPAAPTLTPNAEASVIDKLSRAYTAAAKTTAELSRQVNIMDAGLAEARKGNLAAGSQAVLVTFQKILDPTSVVRESEYARSAAGQSLMAQMQGYMERLAKGGAGVPLTELEKYASVARKLTQGQSGYLNAQRERVGKVADHYNIPRELVIDSYDFGAKPASGPPLPADTQAAVDRLFGKQ